MELRETPSLARRVVRTTLLAIAATSIFVLGLAILVVAITD